MNPDSQNSSPALVRDLMSVGVVTCSPDTPLIELARLMLEKNLEAVVVLDPADGHALGMVSQEEIVQAYSDPEARQLTAEKVMREGLPKAPPDIPLTAAAQLMRDQHTRVLFMTHHAGGIEYPTAMISYQHLLRHLAARNPEELRDLGIKAERKNPLDAFIERRNAARRRNLGENPPRT